MKNPADRTRGGGARREADEAFTVAHVADLSPEADTWAWGAIHLDDGRVISIAWLRGWRGAVAGRWRDG